MAKPASDTAASPDPAAEFYIPASASLLESRPRTLKHGDTFAMFDHYGDIPAAPHSPAGLFHEDTRHLSHLELSLEGHRPLLLISPTPMSTATAAWCSRARPCISSARNSCGGRAATSASPSATSI